MNAEFWKGRRVFLTGHTGFKGSWLALWLERLGARVTGFSLAEPVSAPSLFERARVASGIESLAGDLRDREAVAEAVARARPEVVLHLGAQSLVHEGYREPVATYATNVLGTAHLLEAVRLAEGVLAVVSVTTDKCYRNREWEWGYRESDELGGHDPYSSSKAAAELVTAAYRTSFLAPAGIGVATARSGNVLGGGDWAADRLVPDLVRAFVAGRAVPIRRPEATRPWQHVLEPLRGYLELAERLAAGEVEAVGAWNFGPDDSDNRPVRWIADRVVEAWGEGARWEHDGESHPPEATFLKLDCSKAKSRLGWHPALPLAQALDWLVDWYREEARGGDARELTVERIDRYQALLDAAREGA